MYNGIGLQTPRGSGTNGYVQRNLAFVKSKKDRVDYKTEEELAKLDQSMSKQPNREILDHERKRKVELKCMEMQELMEEQGYSEKEVNDKVNMFRKMLMAKEGVSDSTAVEKDEHGRPIAKETHQLAEANQEKNARLKEAFGLTDYVEGSAFDPDRKAKEEAAKAAALAHKKYTMVHSSDEEAEAKESTPSTKKKRKKSRHESTSPERSRDKRKKSRKHKRDSSYSRHSKSKHRSKRRSRGHKKHRRHHISSSSESDSHGDSEDSGLTVPAVKASEVVMSTNNHTNGHTPQPGEGSAPHNRREEEISALPSTPPSVLLRNGSPPISSISPKPSPLGGRGPMKQLMESAVVKKSSLSAGTGAWSNVSRSRSQSRSHRSGSHKRSIRRSSSLSSSSSSSSSRSRSRSPSPKRRSSSSRSLSSASERHSHRNSRSPSIRRRTGSPSHLDKRRITRPKIGSNTSSSQDNYYRSRDRYRSFSRSRSRSRSGSRSRRFHRRNYY